MTRPYFEIRNTVFEIERLKELQMMVEGLVGSELREFTLQEKEEDLQELFGSSMFQMKEAEDAYTLAISRIIDYRIGEAMKKIDAVPDGEFGG